MNISQKTLERILSKYLSRHSAGQEAYEFNIKIQKINIPKEIRESVSEDDTESVYDIESKSRLVDFAEGLLNEFPWIHKWYQEGRSGGWLVLYPREEIFDDYGNVTDIDMAKRRHKDLIEISRRVLHAKGELIGDMESKGWWAERYPQAFRIPRGVKEWRPPE